MKAAILASILASSAILSANAATIKYEGNMEGLNVISITGQIEAGDANRFKEIAATLTGPTVVRLRSPGGLVVDGLNIGIAIHSLGYQTAVLNDAVCASACGLIWLAGKPRLLTESSKIGFHAASRGDGQESGKGNAFVGAYLGSLDLSYEAIAYLTDAPPGDMQWLSASDAAKVGITYSLIKPPKSEPRPFIAQPQYQVEELQHYRSDFFGELRRVLVGRPGIQIIDDRFVFQSEVLFPVGSADLSVSGWEQIKALAATLLDISKEIPLNVDWILRVDGHAARQPVQGDRFPSNWELSSARAITVVKLLIAAGVPADRLAATAFGDTKPLDPSDTPDAYAKNRRIELQLTDR